MPRAAPVSSAWQASAVTYGMSAAHTRTGPAASSSAWMMPTTGWRGSSGSSQRSTPSRSGSSLPGFATNAIRSQTDDSAAAG